MASSQQQQSNQQQQQYGAKGSTDNQGRILSSNQQSKQQAQNQQQQQQQQDGQQRKLQSQSQNQQQQQQQQVTQPIHEIMKPFKEPVNPLVLQKASRYAVRVLEEMSKRSTLLKPNSKVLGDVAKFDRDEVIPYLGELLGRGGFNNVYELKKIVLKTNTPHFSDSTNNNDQLRKKVVLSKPKLAIKFLSDDILLNPEDACNGSADLLMESKYLTALASHPHPALITLHGISSTGPAGFMSPERAGFFLIVDRLYDTLDRRIDVWRELQRRKLAGKAITGLLQQQQQQNTSLTDIAIDSTEATATTTTTTTTTVNDVIKYCKVLFIQRLLTGYEIVSALAHLHSLKIIFRDLKPDNVGFDYEGRVKIFDFGLAKELDPNQQTSDQNGLYNMSGGTGSRRFMAPEVSLSEPYGLSADMYSFAIVLWELLTLEKAFGRMPVDEHREKVLLGTVRPPINTNEWNADLVYTLEGCWRRDPLTRPTSNDVQDELKSILKNIVSKDFPYKNKVPTNNKQVRVSRRSTRHNSNNSGGGSTGTSGITGHGIGTTSSIASSSFVSVGS